MDKYEYRVKTEQMKECALGKDYKTAMQIADTIDWRRVKSAEMLCSVSEIYEFNGQFGKARHILFIAYDHAPENRKIIYRLGVLALKLGDASEAMDCYEEFLIIAPKDPNQYILRYKILKAQGASYTQQIEALERFKKIEYVEKWAYELAVLYHEAGMASECLEECDDLVLWFNEGKHIFDAMELKLKYKPLTQAQQTKYEQYAAQYGRALKTPPVVTPVAEPTKVPEKPVEESSEDDNYGATTVINDEELQAIRDAAEAPTDVATEEEFDKTVKIDVDAVEKELIAGAIPVPAAVESVITPTVEPKIGRSRIDKEDSGVTGQLRLEEILMGWEEKQKEMEVAIAQEREKAEIEAEAAAILKAQEEELARQAELASQEEKEPEPVLPDDIRQLMEDIENGVESKFVIDDVEREKRDQEFVENKGAVVADLVSVIEDVEDEYEDELEDEPEDEYEDEFEDEYEDEPEDEYEDELEDEYEDELEDEYEDEFEDEYEDEPEDEYEDEPEDEYEDEPEDEYEDELEDEYEDEPEDEYEDELEVVEDSVEELEALVEATVEIEIDHDYDAEEQEEVEIKLEDEFEDEFSEEAEDEYDDEFLEDEFEDEYADEFVDEVEDEYADEFADEFVDEVEEDEYADEFVDEVEEDEFVDEFVDEYEFADDDEFEVYDPSMDDEFEDEQELKVLSDERVAPSRIEMAKAVATGKTAKLPTAEIARAVAAGNKIGQDTGFIVQARYDLDTQSEIGLRAGLTEEQKKLFSYFVPVRGMSEQLVDVLESDKNCTNRGGTSKTGNLLVIGNKGSGKTVLAVDVVKAIQRNRNINQGKVSIVTGEALNKKKISEIFSKMYGGALIIEKANGMNEKTVIRLNKAMERETGEILIVLEDERKPLDTLLASNMDFRRKFTSRLEVPVFINDELVTFGQTYAKENECRIDEMGILALYSRIDALQREDHPVTVAEVKDIVDEAIDRSKKVSVKMLTKRIFGKGDDNDSRIVLTEKNFSM